MKALCCHAWSVHLSAWLCAHSSVSKVHRTGSVRCCLSFERSCCTQMLDFAGCHSTMFQSHCASAPQLWSQRESHHELMQCASSTANKVRCPFELMAFRVPMKPSVLSSSGVMKRRRMVGAADLMSCRMLARSWAVLVDDRKSHLMLFFLRLAT